MAQVSDAERQKQIEQLKKDKAKLDAEKELLDSDKAKLEALKAKLEAEKALDEAQKALKKAAAPATKQISELQNEKALLDAQKEIAESQKALAQAKSASGQQAELQNQKSLADAQKQLADAQTQSAIARYIGDVKAGAYSGSVDMKEKAGTEEALLLAARAIKEGAARVAAAVKDQAETFYIFNAKDFPTFQRLLSFRFRQELIKQAFTAAGVSKQMAGDAEETAPALVSAGLEAFSKIIGFFKTDYTIGGIDAKIDDSLLLFSVAGQLKGKEVHLPSIYEPSVLGTAINTLTSELAALIELRTIAASQAKAITDAIAEAEKKAAAAEAAATAEEEEAGAESGETEAESSASVEKKDPRLDQLNAVIALYDSFASSLTTSDANGIVPLSAVAQEFAIEDALKAGAAVLLVRLENSGGGYLLKKNILTGLGAMPLYHMGGATVAYLLLSGVEGRVLAGDVIPVYGGFVRTDALRAALA